MEYRIEKDTMGEVKVPAHRYWGAQTERSRNNFKIGPEGSMPIEIIHAFATSKKLPLMPIMNSVFWRKKKKTLSLKFVMKF